ncbi:hypothetical protein ACO03V_13085 [Microbacterium sp. HMH0099]|uniref:hypothetical protein n=1 Tax=Microbacterium sp. HMH0099 TaxID=3414026 RepID=UPI003BF6CC17
MRNKIILVGGVALLAFIVGTRTPRVRVKERESVGHQLVRLWNDPKAKKERRKNAERRAKRVAELASEQRKSAEKRAKALARRSKSTFRRLRK